MNYKRKKVIYEPLFSLAICVALFLNPTLSLSTATTNRKSLVSQLQSCFTPNKILKDIGRHLDRETDPEGTVSSLVLVRLSKQLVTLDNCGDEDWKPVDEFWEKALQKTVQTLAIAKWRDSARSMNAAIEGTKAASILSRILKDDVPIETWEPLLKKWNDSSSSSSIVCKLEAHHLSGLKFAMDCFQLLDKNLTAPICIEEEYISLNLPFRIRPAVFRDLDGFSVSELVRQVEFEVDDIRTPSNRLVKERRQTAWEGDDHVAPFAYSGKAMKRKPWSPLVLQVRDCLLEKTNEYYDGCLLNLYPDGGSGMRYHIDPDQGTLWGFETAVVSVGATRRFAFRALPDDPTDNDKNPQDGNTHVFTLMHGDVIEMFEDCQMTYQHCVRTADAKNEKAARASFVFKKTLPS